jgi:hypothetical protein
MVLMMAARMLPCTSEDNMERNETATSIVRSRFIPLIIQVTWQSVKRMACPIFSTSFIDGVARLTLLIDSRSRGSVTQRRVWPHRVVVDAPALRQDPDLLHRVEDFTVQELIPQFRVEGFTVAVFPRAARFDVSRFGSRASEPLAQISGDEFGPLSERRCPGTSLATITSAGASITLAEFHLRSDRIIRYSQLCSSIRFNIRTVLPSYVFALTKSYDQM